MSAKPTLGELLGVSFKIGCISFGGPAAQIAILQEEFVERRGWIDQPSFLRALNFCMLLPGPEAQQLATYLGLRLFGVAGAVTAGGLFVLPGALVMLGLSWLAAARGDWPPLQAVFRGLLPVVVALVLHAVWRIGRRSLKSLASLLLAVAALTAVQLQIPFPLVVGVALAAGIVLDRFGISPGEAGHALDGEVRLRPTLKALAIRTATYSAAFGALWAAPLALVLFLAGPEPFADLITLFTKAAFVTFGGAYAVLPYIAQAAVEDYSWLSREAMIHGLALAETTPGPLILVTEYVGFFAGWNEGVQGLSRGAAGAFGAGVVLWCTFLPSFYLVLVGAPLIETLTHDRRATAALAGVTSAVVGVITSLAIVIGKAAFIPPQGVDVLAIAIAVAALAILIRFRPSPLLVIAAGGVIGIARWQAGI